MPTHVYANNNEVASKAADGKSIAAFPDVCFSPPAPPVGPLPLPYPNTSEVKDTDKGTAKVFVKDKMSGMAGDSHMTKSMGDEPATKNFNKGMITGALQGKCYFGLWSMDVNMEGKGVPRHMDMVTHNHASMVGNDPCGADVDSSSMSSAIKKNPDEAQKDEEENKDKIHVPIVFLPGFMGSTLCNKQTGKRMWVAPRLLCKMGLFAPKSIRILNIASRVSDNFTDQNTIAYREKLQDIKKYKKNKKSTFLLLYGLSFINIENTLRAITSGSDTKRESTLKKIGLSVSKIFSIKDNQPIASNLISGKDSELKKYTFDVWGCGYNWLESNAKSAEYVGNFIKTDIPAFYKEKGYQYISGAGGPQVFIVTHSMGGLVARHLAENTSYKQNIKGIVFGGIPACGAAAFYYAAHAGAKYLLPPLPSGLLRLFIDTIFANSQGCLELLPFSDIYKSDSPPLSKIPDDLRTIGSWLHVDKQFLENFTYRDIYDVYKDKGPLGVYPDFKAVLEKYNLPRQSDIQKDLEKENTEKKKLSMTTARTRFDINIEGVKEFHSKLKKASVSCNAYYLLGKSPAMETFREVLLHVNKESCINIEPVLGLGDGTVSDSSWSDLLDKIPSTRSVTYVKNDSSKKTFSHMFMFCSEDIINFTCYAILDMLLNPGNS